MYFYLLWLCFLNLIRAWITRWCNWAPMKFHWHFCPMNLHAASLCGHYHTSAQEPINSSLLSTFGLLFSPVQIRGIERNQYCSWTLKTNSSEKILKQSNLSLDWLSVSFAVSCKTREWSSEAQTIGSGKLLTTSAQNLGFHSQLYSKGCLLWG